MDPADIGTPYSRTDRPEKGAEVYVKSPFADKWIKATVRNPRTIGLVLLMVGPTMTSRYVGNIRRISSAS